MIGLYHYQILYELLLDINMIYDERELADHVLKKVAKAFDAEGGAIYALRNPNQLDPIACYGTTFESLKTLSFSVGTGLVGWVAKNRSPMRIGNPKMDPRFSRIDNNQNGFTIRSMLAAPVMFGSQFEGVIQFVNKRGSIFGDADEELLLLLGHVVGSALEKARTHCQLQEAQILQQSAINSLSAGMLVVNLNKNILLCNNRAQEIFDGFSPRIQEGSSMNNLEKSSPALWVNLNKALTQGQASNRQESSLILPNAEKLLGYSCVPVFSTKNQILGATLLVQDISHLKAPALPSANTSVITENPSSPTSTNTEKIMMSAVQMITGAAIAIPTDIL